ncbi:unnamed protein product [Oncorhynchus mykiss]|uniref:Uncharacterized protein n=1 Tax=Oncorhynchus mykiss TaxID=8022 RepID=A0A060WU27_ONCMY|nr:unnamed protein product [Oncorhynchus mykiss]
MLFHFMIVSHLLLILHKKYSFISLCLKPEMWQKVAKFKGAEYFRKALYILYSISSTASLCNTCITSHFVYILISYVYTVLNTIYCILPMPLCTITHSYIFMYIFFILLHL